MALIVSNGSRTHIEKSITPPSTAGYVAFQRNIIEIMEKCPFKNHNIDSLAHSPNIKCWGFKERKFSKLYRNITAGDHLLLFENLTENGKTILNPRVFYGKVTYKAINPTFATTLWGPEWHYVYFLTEVHELHYSKDYLLLDSGCFSGPYWYRFKQQRFA